MRSIPFTFCGAAVVAVTLMPASVALADTGSGQEKGLTDPRHPLGGSVLHRPRG